LSIDDDLSANPLDNDLLHKLVEEMGLDRSLADSMNNSSLSQKQIGEIAKACVDTLQKHGRITPELLSFLSSNAFSPTNVPTSVTPNDRPDLPSSDKVPSSSSAHRRFMVPELYRYFGFRQLKNWTSILDVAQENISINLNHGDIPIELGNVANIKKSRRNKVPIARPPHFLSRVHMDIGYGDCRAVGGVRYCDLFVDRATREMFIYGLKTLTHNSLIAAFQQFRTDAGDLPKVLITDFDSKIFGGATGKWLEENKCSVRAAPPRRQNQNGLVERAWETITNMARSYITDMQMPWCYWYWALRHAVHVANYLPCTVNGLSTTPHELVYGVKPDLRTLFRLFSTGYSNTFNLQYEGGIFVGLYDSCQNTSQVEPFPQGTSVVWPLKDANNKTIQMRGTVISVPLPLSDCQLPASADDAPPYVIQLVDGSIHRVAPLIMDDIVVPYHTKSSPHGIAFPSWLGISQKVMFSKDGTYIKGFME